MSTSLGKNCFYVWLLLAALPGCGTTKNRVATEQMLVSDAVDLAVADIDFRPLAGHDVYFDTSYIQHIKGIGFVNAEYIISALRQQMIAADCRLQENRDDAEYIVEARVGTVGTDSNEIVYGIPASTGLSTALSFVPGAPPVPAIPEIAFARKDAQSGAAKVAVFAYHRETGSPIWQSGISKAKSSAKDFWVFGAGPFQRGSIYDGTQFAGERIRLPDLILTDRGIYGPPVTYFGEHLFGGDPQHPRIANLPEEGLPDTGWPSGSDSSWSREQALPPLTEHWLTPLEPRIVTPLESALDWR